MADMKNTGNIRTRLRWSAVGAIAVAVVIGSIPVSTTSAGTVEVDTESPGAPPSFGIVSVRAYNRITLGWGQSTDDTGIVEYQVLRNGEMIASVGGSTHQLALEDLPHGNAWLQVRAVDRAGNTSVSTPPAFFAVDRRPPPAPTVLSATYDPTRNDMFLTFVAEDVSVEFVRYRIYQNGVRILTTSPAGGVQKDGNKVTARLDAAPGTRYFQVDETDVNGNVSVRSAPLMVVVPQPDRRAPSAPANVTAAVVDGAVHVQWDASDDDVGVVSYRLLSNGDDVGVPVTATSAVLELPDVPSMWIQVVATDASNRESVNSAPFRLDLVP